MDPTIEFVCFACAREMIHTYSFIHDDLPGVDNGTIRRGRLICHKDRIPFPSCGFKGSQRWNWENSFPSGKEAIVGCLVPRDWAPFLLREVPRQSRLYNLLSSLAVSLTTHWHPFS